MSAVDHDLRRPGVDPARSWANARDVPAAQADVGDSTDFSELFHDTEDSPEHLNTSLAAVDEVFQTLRLAALSRWRL